MSSFSYFVKICNQRT